MLKRETEREYNESLLDIYNLWENISAKQDKKGYISAFKHFSSLQYYKFTDITIDDYQECLNECGKGTRTRQVMGGNIPPVPVRYSTRIYKEQHKLSELFGRFN